jgi:hypothetical protein
MAKRVAAILYLFTALATLDAGLASFRFLYAALSPIHVRWTASFAVIYFAAPITFFLAGVSALWKDEESKASKWITAGVVLFGLSLFFLHQGSGWRSLAEAAGALLSAVFILGSLVKQSSNIAVIATIIYAASHGDELVLRLRFYWAFGGSIQNLLATITTPILVLVSLVIAVTLHVKSRSRNARVHLDDSPDSMELRPPE